MTERWLCGAYRCDAVVTGQQDRTDHLRTEHRNLFGLLYIPYEGPDVEPGPSGVDTEGPGERGGSERPL